LDTITDSTTDLTAAISLTTGTSSTANIGTVDNQFGAIDLTVSAGGTATTVDALTAATVAVTATGGANLNLGTVTSTTTTTIDASGLNGELTANLTGVGTIATVTTAGGVTSITTANGATTATNITLGAENGVNDHLVMNGVVSGLINLTNFNAGATNGDDIDISVVGIEGRNMLGGAEDLVLAGNAGTSVAAAQAVVVTEASAALDLGTAATTMVVALTGDYATTGLVETAIETGGSRALTVNGAVTAATDIMLILYDDGTNSYLATLTTGANIADNGLFAAGQATVTNVITFVGVADCTTLDANNLGAALIA
ncbi:MAG: hypothetical protein P8L39_10890, partial [Halioglobus sp.]|nr:hypothetical protein [Halioglobus sp.]